MLLFCFFFNYGVGIHKRKEDFLKKKKDVMYLLSYTKEWQSSL